MFAVVVRSVPGFDGEASSRDLEATILEVSGDSKVALLTSGFARRATAAGFGLGVVAEKLMLVAGSPRSFALLGVGVAGGGAAVFLELTRRLCGVDGASGSGASCLSAVSSAIFRFLGRATGAEGGGGIASGAGLASAAALILADLRVAITDGLAFEKR